MRGLRPSTPQIQTPEHGSDGADDSARKGTTAPLKIEMQVRPSDERMRQCIASENRPHAHWNRTDIAVISGRSLVSHWCDLGQKETRKAPEWRPKSSDLLQACQSSSDEKSSLEETSESTRTRPRYLLPNVSGRHFLSMSFPVYVWLIQGRTS